jgi:hypothetical protein
MAKFLGKSTFKSGVPDEDGSSPGTSSHGSGYIPPHALMKKLIRREKTASGDEMVTMPLVAFRKLLEAAVAGAFDEKHYLERYGDIREAVNAGRIHSGLDHFVNDGYLEGRPALAHAVDEEWYVSTYPDVALAIKSGKVRNAAHHFEVFGYSEGRVPNKSAQRVVAEWRELEKKAKP